MILIAYMTSTVGSIEVFYYSVLTCSKLRAGFFSFDGCPFDTAARSFRVDRIWIWIWGWAVQCMPMPVRLIFNVKETFDRLTVFLGPFG